MSETLTAVEINCTTGEVVERPLTQEEISEMEASSAATAARKAQEEADAQARAELKASAKAKLIAGQPLTAEEADVLVI